ncbi:TIGR03668 family PPOX class F420-dependent oxidoreductase [Streptomyces sulphureus]|uniref:TIGR03668 family PPOX class F420-dependent oxidoreductase n=1 Tax=Streptomyces sulphureus TaxID=47758 RepID=UPI00037BC08C|nr:TIGR03668 family PPOX class F420-dependent oxidoreductase [Streptomyces sulphureus]
MPRLTTDEAYARFAAARVAHLATADAAGRPHLVPVVFAVRAADGASPAGVVLAVDHKPKRTTSLKRLANIRANPAVSILTDTYDEDWTRLWWSRCDGTARVLPPRAESPQAARLAGLLVAKYPEQYTQGAPEGPVVEVAAERWSGWRAG